ncbi:putative MFS-type transporter YcaD [bacterium HR40]|nr:putative MFS-type transporter YcaD [bacterium HR40]
MVALIAGNWALLFGILVLMIGHGLQGTLLSLGTAIAGFPTGLAGIVLSGYFLGLLAGSLTVQHLISRVGHVRVFAAMGAIASTTILFHVLVVEPFAWLVLRIVTGYCFAGIYIVAESWLNASTTNDTRGRLLSVYMALQTLGFAIGPLLLNFTDPASFEPFVWVSVTLSLAVVPMLLTAVPTPSLSAPARFGLGELYRTSPLGCVAIVGVGVTLGAVLGIGPLFGRAIGLEVFEITFLMSLLSVGGAVLQWPFGRISDHTDRRYVLIAAAAGAALWIVLGHLAEGVHRWLLYLCFFLFSGFTYPLYSLSVAHTNDFLRPQEMVAASSAILLANGIGATLGPSLGGFVLDALGPGGFVAFVAAVNLAIAIFGIYRSTVRPPVPATERSPWVALPQTTPVGLELACGTAAEGTATPEGKEPTGARRDKDYFPLDS